MVEVTSPDEFRGEVMGDRTSRRGQVQAMSSEDGCTVVRARVPEAELYKHSAALRSMTHGRGSHVRSLAGYEPSRSIWRGPSRPNGGKAAEA